MNSRLDANLIERESGMLYPQLGPQYYDTKHADILAKMEAFYSQSVTINQQFWGEAMDLASINLL